MLIFLLLLGIPNVSVYANGGSFGRLGEVVFPLEDRDIKMVSERIIGNGGQDSHEVNCEFTFLNLTDELKKIEIGFPIHGLVSALYENKKSEDITDRDILVIVDGKKVSVDLRAGMSNPKLNLGGAYPLVFVFPVEFGPHERKKVKIRYHTWYFSADDDVIATRSFIYVTKTGALWSGNIENAEFSFALPGDYSLYAPALIHVYGKPGGYKIVGGRILWSFKDWKPKEEISINVQIGHLQNLLGLEMGRSLEAREYVGDRKLYSKNDLVYSPKREYYDTPVEVILKAAYLWVLRNEIYARRGYKFGNPVLAEFFSEFAWYAPKKTFSDSGFSSIERKNLEFIKQQEKALKKQHYLRYIFPEPSSSKL
jgi:hypothetical protein